MGLLDNHCESGDFRCVAQTYLPYIGGAIAIGVSTAVLAPLVLPATLLEASLFGVGTEAVIATGAMAL